MLKLGYKASAEQFAPSRLLQFSVVAEQVGFDCVFISDHFQPWKHTDGHAPNALAWLGALGASTQRVVMGTSFNPSPVPTPRTTRPGNIAPSVPNACATMAG